MRGPHAIARRGTNAGTEHAGFHTGQVSTGRMEGGCGRGRAGGGDQGRGERRGQQWESQGLEGNNATTGREGTEETQVPLRKGSGNAGKGP